jgi:DnaJ-class molecular chaperone
LLFVKVPLSDGVTVVIETLTFSSFRSHTFPVRDSEIIHSMAKLHTHYDNLKVARNAPPEVIRAAYKTLSQRYHPDRNAGDASATRTFQIISSAYETLSDPVRRQEHDAWIVAQEAAEAMPGEGETARPPEAPEGEYLLSRGPLFRNSRSAVKTVALTLRSQSTEQRTFTYVFCSVVATLVLVVILI